MLAVALRSEGGCSPVPNRKASYPLACVAHPHVKAAPVKAVRRALLRAQP